MRVSVAMTTYKSKRFLKEQLESIFAQLRLPDELIICDDASPDDTYEYTQKLLKDAPKGIRIVHEKNEKNLGYLKNFSKVFSLCKGDVIFPCDADDIWENNKISMMIVPFENDPNVVMTFADAFIIDAEGNIIGDSLCDSWDTRKNKQDEVELSIISAMRKGCPYGMSLCLRRNLVEKAIPFMKNVGHDEWFSMMSSCFGKVVFIDEKLARYRRHGNNTSGIKPSIWRRLRTWDRESWFTHAEDIKNAYDEFLRRYGDFAPACLRVTIEDQLAFQAALNTIVHKRWGGGILLLKQFLNSRYTKYRGTWKTFVFDELYLFKHLFG